MTDEDIRKAIDDAVWSARVQLTTMITVYWTAFIVLSVYGYWDRFIQWLR